ncbi:DUF5067 domain-containing protein [Bifidobacterium biavatii]|uniref:Integral membrane protein n=1 Tax=Bifidobacterium biavatii DSM 23969 TaxID=1437608 RepID=A0A086ZUM0_9BIFI|nr:DUF5067 domain-containing protein [Bifidobacterium biavatii]KFI50220.1 integral membrane protein [Bifidobacterium biavatii DSM 23969]
MSKHPDSQTPAQPAHLTVCGVIGTVFGALGLLLSFIPIVNNLAAILGFIGVLLALVALVGTFRGKKSGKALAVIAAVLSVLAIVITLAMQSATSKAIDDAVNGATSQGQSSSSSGKSETKTETKGEQDMEGDLKDLHVKIVSAAKSDNDYEGKPTVLVTYEWTNKTDKNNSFAVLAHPQVFQNGQALDTAVYAETPESYDANSYMAEVQPNATGTATIGYVLKDDSAITVDVTDLISLDDATKVTYTFELQ